MGVRGGELLLDGGLHTRVDSSKRRDHIVPFLLWTVESAPNQSTLCHGILQDGDRTTLAEPFDAFVSFHKCVSEI